MIDMEQASPPLANAAPVPDTLCPRCQKPLVDPHGLGWCQACGYCRSLAEDRARLPLAPAAKSRPQVPRLGEVVHIPLWGIVLLAGVALLAVGSWAAGRYLPLQPLPRAIWATVQAGVGLLVMFLGQAYGLFRIAPEEAALHFVDAVIPFRLYGLVCKRLPRMASVLCIGSWGLTLTLSGLLLIGGLAHWLKYLPKSQESQQRR
jgi:hypothetical protein